MRCPECGSSQIFVINSRPRDGINAVWRKRRCNSCGYTWNTLEQSIADIMKKHMKQPTE